MEITGVYILQCRNDRYYVGSSKDIKLRFEQHQSGKVKATKYVLPVTLKAIIPCSNATEARKLEWQIKKAKSRKKIDDLISKNGSSVVEQSDVSDRSLVQFLSTALSDLKI